MKLYITGSLITIATTVLCCSSELQGLPPTKGCRSSMVKRSYEKKAVYTGHRLYEHSVTPEEKKSIRFILKTLSEKSLTSLWSSKSQLEFAGELIEHIHPLRFLECVFRDEELKVYIHNIKKRGGYVWSEFVDGLKESLREEALLDNLKEEYLAHFCNTLSISFSAIESYIFSHHWEEFVKSLIVNIPRDGNAGKYDQ